MPPQNNWDVSYSHISFLERVLGSHQRIDHFRRNRDIAFRIERKDSLPEVVAILITRYTVSLADVINVLAEFPEATCIVTSGDWNGYTQQAKEYALEQNIGLFNTSEFFGALWRRDVATYVKRDSDGRPIYAYRSA
jgi:hypothetical protein